MSHRITDLPPYSFVIGKEMSRRSFLVSTSLAAASLWSSQALGVQTNFPKFPDYPFKLGVASGDPVSDGFVLWTRLAPLPLEGGGMPQEAVMVSWEVAEDEQMSKVVKRGEVTANPEWAHSVHVEVEGLKPDRWYWYRFKAGSEISPVGRTRTMPHKDATPERLRFAFASCQRYEDGYYTAYEHMAQEDLDLMIHLGDYIYEYKISKNAVRPETSDAIRTLEDYRNRYALYKTDPSLQRMHALVPWIVTWDDHEAWNDIAGAAHRSVSQLRMRAASYKAYYEHMPLRRTSLPAGPDMQLYRGFSFGQLAELFVLDTRQYRTLQPGKKFVPQSAQALDPKATILGESQRQWLFGGLRASAAKWNVMAQQVQFAKVDRVAGEEVGYSMDKWTGYEADRLRVLKLLREESIRNPVVLTGDIHSNWANELIADLDQPDSPSVATEFVGTSISSGGDGQASPANIESMLSENPFVKFHNRERGYVRCELSPTQWRTDYRTVAYVKRKGAPLNTRASFVVESGRPRLQKA